MESGGLVRPLSTAAVILLCAGTCGCDARAEPPHATAAHRAADVVITANPLGGSILDSVKPTTVLSGRDLGAKLEPTLGETLTNEVGVSSSYFGPGASRPVIRGLDGERIKLLNNGAGLIDASGASPDHAVAYDPLVADRIEVVRGPATLLYGASAIGGVINSIDNRIPDARPDNGFSGTGELRFGGPAAERAGVVKLDGGIGRFALHVDGYARKTDDLRIPDYQRSQRLRERSPLPPGQPESRGIAINSATDSAGGAVGGSLLFDRGHVGASVSQFDSRYGTVADPTVVIDMKKNRYDLAGDFHDLDGFLAGVKFRTGYTDYKHDEFQASALSTVFANRGYDGRMDLRHRAVGSIEGTIGVQFSDTRFSALGAEALVPPVSTRVVSAFIYEEAPLGPLRVSAGGRVDATQVAAEADSGFGPADSKRFNARSGSVGALLPLGAQWALAANYAYNERAPNYAELFANGPHVGTGQFEVGRRDQNLERSNAFDLALRKRAGFVTGSLGVFAQRFSNFIALLPTGALAGLPGRQLPESVFEGVRADFRGIEVDTRFHLVESSGHAMTLDLRADYTRAQDESRHQPLPRIAPFRIIVAANYTHERLSLRADLVRAASQHRTADNELPTDGYVLVNARAGYQFPAYRGATLELFVRANNLLDEDVRLHTSTLKDIVPLGRRSVMAGVSATF